MNTSVLKASRRVLVVDDIEANRIAMELELRDRGFEVTTCDGGEAAFALLSASKFDVLVTDIWMPEGDGITLLRNLRSQQPGLLIYAVTGGGPGMSLASASALAQVWDARRVHIKPFDIRKFVSEIIVDLNAENA